MPGEYLTALSLRFKGGWRANMDGDMQENRDLVLVWIAQLGAKVPNLARAPYKDDPAGKDILYDCRRC